MRAIGRLEDFAAHLALVGWVGARDGTAVRFIVCDKRSDINRVALTTAHVDQWKCDAEALARFVGEQLGLRTHGDVTLVVADTAVALADLLDFERGAYVLDTAAIRHLVDAATTADPRLGRNWIFIVISGREVHFDT